MLSRPEFETPMHKILQSARNAAARIPPAWPLKATVAVNPFLGHATERFCETSDTIRRLTGKGITLSRSWFLEQIRSGQITREDLSYAVSRTAGNLNAATPEALISELGRPEQRTECFRSITDIATANSEIDLTELAQDCIGNWAAAYFDEGQALWTPRTKASAWQDWRIYSRHDLTPEIYGLTQFAERSDDLPGHATDFIAQAVRSLEVPAGALDAYFHHLLFGLLGWSQIARYREWQAELSGGTDDTIIDLLAIRLFWEVVIYENKKQQLAEAWRHELSCYSRASADPVTRAGLMEDLLQTALDRSVQRQLITEFGKPPPAAGPVEPFAQIAFCIDVRSEPMRRSIETLSDQIETLGFAGFFGLPVSHDPFASDYHEHRLPVLLSPALNTRTLKNDTPSDLDHRYSARAVRAWGRFKLAAVSSFAFVEAAGAMYLGKLASQQFLKQKTKSPPPPQPVFADELTKEEKAVLAKTVLGAMSLTSGFRDLVVLCGHGASVVNNPHESALHCGACGGYAGDVSARLLAGLLNDPETRAGLTEHGICVPETTRFVGALHDTTTDEITLFDEDCDVKASTQHLDQLKAILSQAALANRMERQSRLPGANNEAQVIARSRDWAQIRPEWGLAGCKFFIAAPRTRTLGRDLGGEAFLHSYDWRQDKDFKVLELILTAPVVVASWISLQYFGSTVAPDVYGGGNKLLHNVVGGMGVLEGNGGPLRTGLPIQSVHDGEKIVHLPVRLSVTIEAPVEAINDVLARHPGVKALFDNSWLHLFQMNNDGQLAAKYDADLAWTSLGQEQPTLLQKELVP